MRGPIEETRYELTVSASSADVLLALTDFGPMRPQIWPETSHPRVYRIYEVGGVTADVTEGVPQAWSRERYDWSQPGTVTLTQIDSNVSRNGSMLAADRRQLPSANERRPRRAASQAAKDRQGSLEVPRTSQRASARPRSLCCHPDRDASTRPPPSLGHAVPRSRLSRRGDDLARDRQ